MKTAVTVLVAGAVVAGLIYYLKDNEELNKVLGTVKDKASGAIDDLKNRFDRSKERAVSQISELA